MRLAHMTQLAESGNVKFIGVVKVYILHRLFNSLVGEAYIAVFESF